MYEHPRRSERAGSTMRNAGRWPVGLVMSLLAIGCNERQILVGPDEAAVTVQNATAAAMGMSLEDLANIPLPINDAPMRMPLAPLPAGAIVLNLEDLEAGVSHAMVNHSPYQGINFSGFPSGFPHAINHWDNIYYGLPVSGSRFLVNWFGQDGESMDFVGYPGGVTFFGAWAANPHSQATNFWFDGYNGTTFVGASAPVALTKPMQWVPANFSSPVTRAVIRRTPCRTNGTCWWVMDDITFSPKIQVAVDIRPDSDSNPINLRSPGRLPVAILAADDFDVAKVDPSTVTLGNDDGIDTGIATRRNGSLMASLEDVDDDGDLDLVMLFDKQALLSNSDLDENTTELTLNGETFGGRAIQGGDSVNIVPAP